MTEAAIYGHRGAAGEAPENTIEAFAYGLAAGAAGFETDIAVTADFRPVLHHDPNLPDGRLIKNLLLSALPPQIPTLESALAKFPTTNWLLEIKTYPPSPQNAHPPAIMAAQTLKAINASKIAHGNITIMAFDWRALSEISQLAPHLQRACLTSPKTEAARKLWWDTETAPTPHAVVATGATAWAPEHTTLTANQIRQAKSLNLKIYTWTINTTAEFNCLNPLADIIITDIPSRFCRP
jgi:glycerophosphoryl diester phosphodiesterase